MIGQVGHIQSIRPMLSPLCTHAFSTIDQLCSFFAIYFSSAACILLPLRINLKKISICYSLASIRKGVECNIAY